MGNEFYRYYKMYRDNGEHAGTTDSLEQVLSCHPSFTIETRARRNGREDLDDTQSYEHFWDSHIRTYRWKNRAQISYDLPPDFHLYRGERTKYQILLGLFQETSEEVQRWIETIKQKI